MIVAANLHRGLPEVCLEQRALGTCTCTALQGTKGRVISTTITSGDSEHSEVNTRYSYYRMEALHVRNGFYSSRYPPACGTLLWAYAGILRERTQPFVMNACAYFRVFEQRKTPASLEACTGAAPVPTDSHRIFLPI